MKNKISVVLYVLAFFCLANPAWAQTFLQKSVSAELPALINDYKKFHEAPELSGHEENTSAFIAGRLKEIGYEVTEHLGKFNKRPWKGYGVVGEMKNGEGLVVLVRTDMDALPIEEKTGLAYASNVKTTNDAGVIVPVMHACGHDIHMSVFLGVAKMLADTRNRWKGTVLMIAQPAEEGGPGASGAEAMLNDGLYTRFPKPDFTLGLHQVPNLVTGHVGVIAGYTNAISGGGEIVVHGVAAHPARPQDGKDPIVLAAQIILALQTIVSREVNPVEPATLTVGAIHGGVAENAIPDEVRLRLSLRALNPAVFYKMMASINRIVTGTAMAAGIAEDKMPEVLVKEAYPANYNDPALTARLKQVFERTLGAERVENIQPLLTGEDFSYYSRDKSIPNFYFDIGSTSAEKFNSAVAVLPANHSPFLAPEPGETITTGVVAMTSAVLELLKK